MKSNFFSSNLLLNAVAIASVVLVSCNNNSNDETPTGMNKPMTDTTMPRMMMDLTSMPMVDHAEAELSGTYADTTVNGSVKFDMAPGGNVTMILDITIPAKAGRSVAIHIHEHGDCGDSAMLAHGHWNPTNKQHGKWGSESFHAGDIGNIKLNAKGKGTLSLTSSLWMLGGKSVRNVLGKSIIVHGGIDDYTTQPTGNSGTRIGCGVIK
jgi:superoxide dismutase, Cu-Zn family